MLTGNDNVNIYRRKTEHRNINDSVEKNEDFIGTRLFTFLITGAIILTTFAISWVVW